MIRRVLDLVVALALVGAGVVVAARVAEPSVRPVLYPPSASPSPVPPPTTVTATTAPPVTTTLTPSTTTVVPTSATTMTTTTTTTLPVDEGAVLTASYVWGRSRDAVLLQTVLGVEADGWYGPGTRQAHLAENAARGLSVEDIPSPPTTTAAPTTTVPTTMDAPTTTVPTTMDAPTTTVPTTTDAPTTTVPTTTVPPPSTTAGMFGGLGAKLVAQLLGQPCIADGDLSDCGPEVDALVKGLVR